ncbi:hypothetical protein ABIB26_003199 [Arthrobacter sp. UYEF20]
MVRPSTTSLSAGFATADFSAVRALFDSFLAEDPDYSAQLAVYRDGAKVLELTGGPQLAPVTSPARSPAQRAWRPS